MTDAAQQPKPKKKRKPRIPTGNAGEYFVMGELLCRGYDAQLADRNTKGYDLLVGRSTDLALRKVQVKSGQCPLYPRKRTLDRSRRMSAKGQKATLELRPGARDRSKSRGASNSARLRSRAALGKG
jgi:hypothetical protein